MIGINPGDRILFRDGDQFGVAKVDLVKDRHVTAFPFDTANRRWARRNRRIPDSFILGKLPSQEHADRVALRIQRLRNERDAYRQTANRWFEDRVRELAALENQRP
jgi:hypothetical protein